MLQNKQKTLKVKLKYIDRGFKGPYCFTKNGYIYTYICTILYLRLIMIYLFAFFFCTMFSLGTH